MMRHASLCLALATALTALPVAAASPADLVTHAERSGFTQTGRYDEVIQLCDAFARHYPKAVRCFEFGITLSGKRRRIAAFMFNHAHNDSSLFCPPSGR